MRDEAKGESGIELPIRSYRLLRVETDPELTSEVDDEFEPGMVVLRDAESLQLFLVTRESLASIV